MELKAELFFWGGGAIMFSCLNEDFSQQDDMRVVAPNGYTSTSCTIIAACRLTVKMIVYHFRLKYVDLKLVTGDIKFKLSVEL
jgi:hypothetical protein